MAKPNPKPHCQLMVKAYSFTAEVCSFLMVTIPKTNSQQLAHGNGNISKCWFNPYGGLLVISTVLLVKTG